MYRSADSCDLNNAHFNICPTYNYKIVRNIKEQLELQWQKKFIIYYTAGTDR